MTVQPSTAPRPVCVRSSTSARWPTGTWRSPRSIAGTAWASVSINRWRSRLGPCKKLAIVTQKRGASAQNTYITNLLWSSKMSQRIDFYSASPEALAAMIALEKAGGKLGIDARLLDLIKLRASQINGCAFCIDLHTTDARKAGESERRLATLSAWRETPFFTERERAVLAWTEALTLLPQSQAPDDVYAALALQLTAAEMVNVTLAIGSINTWNRLAVGFRKMPE